MVSPKKIDSIKKNLEVQCLNEVCYWKIILNFQYTRLFRHFQAENCLNLAKINYLNFLNNQDFKKQAEECIKFYGVGSCGPRGFYGTIGVTNINNIHVHI